MLGRDKPRTELIVLHGDNLEKRAQRVHVLRRVAQLQTWHLRLVRGRRLFF
jgi:UDP-2,3-diacylglucosamine pyrophosphatase LpxH